MSKAKAIVMFVIIAVLFITLVLFTVPLNGQDSFQIGDTNYDFYWISKSIKLGLDLKGGLYAVYTAENDQGLSSSEFDAAMTGAMSNLETLLASKGYTEATVNKQGTNQITIEVPDVSDTDELMSLIGEPATLEFRDADGKVIIRGDSHLRNAYVTTDDSNKPAIGLQFNEAGTKAFADATTANVGKTISIYINDELIVSPTVNTAITNGSAIITGSYTYDTANELATKIRAGALGVRLTLESSETVSPTLGVNALYSGLLAGAIGIMLIIIIMLLAYKGLGLCASLALIIYTELLFLFLAIVPWVQLTLPGIAGIILSIGMAVDANVIIFERIKDERFAGRGIASAVKSGFKNALEPIVDSNITTIIGAVIMLIFGATTIKSFALTLLIGIILSMVTCLLITRWIVKGFLAFNEDSERFYGLHLISDKDANAVAAAPQTEEEGK